MIDKKSPVLLKPVYFTHLWGGTLLKNRLNKDYSQNNVGESWEVSAHEHGNASIASGEYTGMPFGEYYTKVLGNKKSYSLLIKLIGPKKDLSVQVHPNDTYARLHENSLGKKEAWYVLSAPKGSQIVAGVNCTKEQFARSVQDGTVSQMLTYIDCKVGDVVTIEPGMVHALLKDVIVYEVQQNSNITYRIYDWDRVDEITKKPRQLHVKQALDVIEFDEKCQIVKSDDSRYQALVDNEYFSLIKINIDGEYIDNTKGSAAYTLISGEVEIHADGRKLFTLSMGDSFYAPICGNFIIKGKGEMLKSIEK